MKNRLVKRTLSGFLVLVMMFSVLIANVDSASAGESDFQGGKVTYDTGAYYKYDAAYKRYEVPVQCYLSNLGIGKGDKLGRVTIRSFCLVPKQKSTSDNKYHNIIAYECEMSCYKVSTKKYIQGTMEYASVGIKTPAADTRVCSPESTMIKCNVNEQNSTTKSINFSVSGGVTKDNKGTTGSVSGTLTSGRSSVVSHSISYESNGLALTQTKNNKSGYATWDYNYVPKGNVEVDAWLRGTHYTSGLVGYVTDTNASMTGKKIKFSYEIHFGAQYYAGKDEGDRIWNRAGLFDKDYDIGYLQGTVDFSY